MFALLSSLIKLIYLLVSVLILFHGRVRDQHSRVVQCGHRRTKIIRDAKIAMELLVHEVDVDLRKLKLMPQRHNTNHVPGKDPMFTHLEIVDTIRNEGILREHRDYLVYS